ncbi:MAG: class I SAM-dependent methyltransferase [Vicinamibacterales bacterium]|nr:class I SAM-dependent methyltransferase [Vicinamibacterales bacterium]
MNTRHAIRFIVLSALVSCYAPLAHAQGTQTAPFVPQVGQAGKDVVWVPTPQALVDTMLDMAKVTAQDYLIDLGSGDGRTVITAARRGLRAHGIEYEQSMVDLAKQNATAAGVNQRATFVKADLFESDFSSAQVITMFLLPAINMRLRPTILNMKPGTRVVSNSFTMENWQPDESATVTNECASYCTAHLWIVPAKVAGAWQLPQGALTLTQEFQMVSGTLGTVAIAEGRLRGDEIAFSAGNSKYTGRVDGNTMRGTIAGGGAWTATRR